MEEIPNFIGYAAILLGFVLLGFVRGNDHGSIINLAVGVTLVLLAAFSFNLFVDIGALFDVLEAQNQIEITTNEEAKKLTKAWVFVLPAVLAAIGANIISAWFLSPSGK